MLLLGGGKGTAAAVIDYNHGSSFSLLKFAVNSFGNSDATHFFLDPMVSFLFLLLLLLLLLCLFGLLLFGNLGFFLSHIVFCYFFVCSFCFVVVCVYGWFLGTAILGTGNWERKPKRTVQ